MKISVVVAALIVFTSRAASQSPPYEHSFRVCPSDLPCSVTDSFKAADVPRNCCILTVTNGDGQGSDQVRSAEIYFNGEKEVLDRHRQAIVYPRKNNIAKVILEGDPHAKVDVRIAQLYLHDSCELIKDSREHSGTFVAVKGVLYSSFEEFVLLGSQCSDLPHRLGTWVLYPDELNDTPKDVTLKHLHLRLKRTKQAKVLDNYLKQRCGETRVAVTLRGYFQDSSEVVTDLPDGGHILAGFGHMDMYRSRLVVESIEDAEPLPCLESRQKP
jgi:hypothetical protein